MLGKSRWGWGYYNSNANFTTAVPATTTYGSTFTPGASNADGTAVDTGVTLAQDVQLIVIGIGGTAVSAANTPTLMDLLVDPSGGTSWSTLIADLVCGYSRNTGASDPYTLYYTFPLFIKAGSKLGIQARSGHTVPAANATCGIWVFGQPSRPGMWWCGQAVEGVGITPASSSGTAVTPGSSNSWGSWTSIGSPTTAAFGALQFATNAADNTQNTGSYHFEVGYGSTRLALAPFQQAGGTSESRASFGPWLVNNVDVPAGTQMQVRGMASGATIDAYDIAIYGTY